LILWNGLVIDGRHRVEICKELDVQPPLRVVEGTEAQAMALAWSLNQDRRHMTMEQKAMAAARLLPPGRKNKPVSLSCVFRWIADGVQGPDGKRVRLEAARVGGRWLTSVAALERFAIAQTPRFDDEELPTSRTAATRLRASTKAAAELENLGV